MKAKVNSIWGLVLRGLTVSVLSILIASFAITWLVVNDKLSINQLGTVLPIVTGISALLGVVMAARQCYEKRIILGAGIAASLFAILFSVATLAFGGGYEGVGRQIFAICIGSMAGIFLFRRSVQRSKKSAVRRRYR